MKEEEFKNVEWYPELEEETSDSIGNLIPDKNDSSKQSNNEAKDK